MFRQGFKVIFFLSITNDRDEVNKETPFKVGDQDCFEFMMNFSLDAEMDLTCNSLSGPDSSKIECWDQASE